MLLIHHRRSESWSLIHRDLIDDELGPEALEFLPHSSLNRIWSELDEHLDLDLAQEYERIWRRAEDTAWRETQTQEALVQLMAFSGRVSDFQVELLNHCQDHLNHLVDAPVSEPVSKLVSETVSEPVSEPVL